MRRWLPHEKVLGIIRSSVNFKIEIHFMLTAPLSGTTVARPRASLFCAWFFRESCLYSALPKNGEDRLLAPNPPLGVFLHWLGGLASASFYVPYRRVKSWSWETYWLVGGFFSWIIAPWFLAFVMTRNVVQVLRETP